MLLLSELFEKTRKSSIFVFLAVFTVLTVCNTAFPVKTYSLSEAQKRVMQSGSYYFNVEETELSCTVSSGASATENQAIAYNFFISKGYSAAQAAGIVGNMINESRGVNPKAFQGEFNKDVSSADVPTTTPLGWGIVQWTPASKIIQAGLKAGNSYDTIDSLGFQLEFLWGQLSGTGLGGQTANESRAGEKIKATTTYAEAAIAFGRFYERFKGSEDPNNDEYTKRINSAAGIFNKFSGGAPTLASTSSCAGGIVNTDGYSFPIEPQTKKVTGIKIGQTITNHHDGTPAYDLFSPLSSAKVYALYNGDVVNVSTNYGGVPGCSDIQFKADDGFYYWYGHLKNPVVKAGQRVTSGTTLAQVADSVNFDSRCWGGKPHLHIDRGCTINGVAQRAGRDECRDPNFIPFLSKLYESLP